MNFGPLCGYVASRRLVVLVLGNFCLFGLSHARGQDAGDPVLAPFPEVTDVDHAGLIRAWDDEAFERGKTIYGTVCFACHGIDGKKVTVQGARAFATDPLSRGTDPYSLFKVVTFGYATMPQQLWMTPKQRYDVVHYIREAFLKESNPSQYGNVGKAYLDSLPKPQANPPAPPPKSKEKDFGPVLCTNLNRDYSVVLSHRLPGDVTVSYDLLRMQLAGVWTGGYLDLKNTRFHRQRGEEPAVPAGDPVQGLKTWKWAYDGNFDYDQLPPRAPAPEKYMRFLGHYVHGDQAVMSYRIAGTRILELPGVDQGGDRLVFQHTLRVDAGRAPLKLCVAELETPAESGAVLPAGNLASGGGLTGSAAGSMAILADKEGEGFHVAGAVLGDTGGLQWQVEDGSRLILHIAPSATPRTFRILRHSGTGEAACEAFGKDVLASGNNADLPDLVALTKGGPNHFPQPLTVTGSLGESINGYALDTIPVPFDNPYNAWLRTSALGFFDDGRCAVSTYTGDIWIVSGLDEGLEHVTWQRFASGMYEPFGVLVIDGLVHVTCRDGIKRLHDFNDDGYADYYENFFADPDVSNFFHAFCFDLQRDSKGFLYYAKSGQYTSFKEAGAVVKVAPDGRSFEYFATGFRTPNGMGMMPNDRPLCSDNEGNWMPASKISLCRKGGFYGYVQTHRGRTWAPDGGKIDHRKVARPASYDQPILWLPVSEDNSSGSQLWIDDERFGPLAGGRGRLMHSSFGKGWVYYLMLQEVDGITQSACVTLPHQWAAGVQRLRTNPADGQLYGVGLSGWQGPRGGKDGCLQRLRYTGEPTRLVDDVQAVARGLEISVNFDLDPVAAGNPANYQLEMWNYEWHPQYGSPFFSVRDPGKKGTDKIAVSKVRVAPDRRRVLLEVPDLVPCDQLRVRLDLKDAAGGPFREKFYQTIHRIPDAQLPKR